MRGGGGSKEKENKKKGAVHHLTLHHDAFPVLRHPSTSQLKKMEGQMYAATAREGDGPLDPSDHGSPLAPQLQ